jgi:hypothetical protein
MLIGIDFDNTLVDYSKSIEFLALRHLSLPESLPLTKLSIRDYLRSQDREDEWTLFQGTLYGPGIINAQPFAGCIDALKLLTRKGHDIVIVSHKTKYPYMGQPYDLHHSAKEWLNTHLTSLDLFKTKDINSHAFFLESKNEKIQAIADLKCDYFIDDLPEILMDINFPKSTQPILFSPSANTNQHLPIISNWCDIIGYISD